MKPLKLFFALCLLFYAVSVKAQFTVNAVVKHALPGGTGTINPTPIGGTGPFTYSWSPGSITTQDLTAASVVGSYTVKVKSSTPDSVTKVYGLGYKMSWTNLYHVTFRNDSVFPKTGTLPGNAQAISKNTLAANTDGWVENVVQSTTYGFVMGFLDSISSVSGRQYQDIDYGVYVSSGTTIHFVNGGTLAGSSNTYKTGDVLRIERSGSTFFVKKNGTTIYSTTIPSSAVYKVKLSLNNSPVCNIGASFFDSTYVSFPGFVKEIPYITHCIPGSSNGLIKVTPSPSTATHSYTWLPGSSNSSSITGLSTGNYTLLTEDADYALSKLRYDVGYKTNWTNHYGLKSRNDSITFNGTVIGHRNTVSKNTLLPSVNGWAQVVATANDSYFLGFLDSVSVLTGTQHNDIDFGIYRTSIYLYSIHNGTFSLLSYVLPGDVIKFERNSSTFYVYQNREQVYSKSMSSSTAYKLKLTIASGTVTNIGASFVDSTSALIQNFVQDIPVIKHCTPGSTNGSISLVPKTSGATHTYTWSPGGANTNSISSLSPGTYTAEVNDANLIKSVKKYNVGYKSNWTNFKGSFLRNDSLIFKSVANRWNGAVSKNTLLGSTDGWCEVVVQHTLSNSAIGFADSLGRTVNYISDIDYGMWVSNGVFIAIKSGISVAGIGNIVPGDVIRIERTGSNFYIKQNGATVYTSTISASATYKLKACATSASNVMYPLTNVGVSFTDTTNINFPNYVQVEPTMQHASDIDISDAVIKLVPFDGQPGYTYTWSPGSETTSSITSKPSGTYSVTLNDNLNNSSKRTLNLLYKTQWANLENMIFRNDSLISTHSSGYGTARSKNVLRAHEDGEINFVYKNTDGSVLTHIGFLDVPSGSPNVYTDIDQGLYITPYFVYYANNGAFTLLSDVFPGDYFRIIRARDTVRFYHNNYLIKTAVPNNANVNWLAKCVMWSGGKLPNIGCSTPANLSISHTQVDANCGSVSTGSITTDMNGGGEPFTYLWSTGVTTSSINSLPEGIYSLTVTDVYSSTASKSFTIQTCPSWKTNTVTVLRKINNGELNKISSPTWEDSYLEGVKQFNFSDTSKWVSFTVNDTTSNFLFGFGNSLNDTLEIINPVNYKVHLQNRALIVSETDNDGFYNRLKISDVVINDKIKILFSKNGIEYYVNETKIYTSKLFSDVSMRLEAQIYSSESTIKNIRVSHN